MRHVELHFGRLKMPKRRTKNNRPAPAPAGVLYARESLCKRNGYINRSGVPARFYTCARCGLYHEDDAA